jgi:hypothetical protein
MKSAGNIPALRKSTGKTEVLKKFQHFQKYSGTQKCQK